MVKNRFEQVDAPQPDAITLVLWKLGDMAYGRVTIPAALSDGKLPADMTSDKLPAKDAFRGAQHEFRLHPVDRGRSLCCKADPHLASAEM